MVFIKRFLFTLALVLFAGTGAVKANDPLTSIFGEQPTFLDVDDAFQFDFNQKGQLLTLTWQIADDYYLYADKFQVIANGATVVSVDKPEGTQIEDEFFGVSDVYFFSATLKVTLADIVKNGEVKVRYQGCAKAGLCYQPMVKTVPLVMPANSATAVDMAAQLNPLAGSTNNLESQQYQLANDLVDKELLMTLLAFFALGVGLAFTPCVFPMFPILSSIIAGTKDVTFKKGLTLAFIYVQGMAVTYSLLGLLVASMGAQLQGYLQHPAVLVAAMAIFVLLAGAMFGWYNLQLPQAWTNKLSQISGEQKGGQAVGVFVMGALSGLIASPCTTAPLTAALLYVSQTGDMFIGFITLYVLSLGMGLPLLAIGASGGKLLPKSGPWMNLVKVIFGFVILLVPIILLERFVETTWVWLSFSVWGFSLAGYLRVQYHQSDQAKTKGAMWLTANVFFLIASVALVTPFRTLLLPMQTAQVQQVNHLPFKMVSSLQDIKYEVNNAQVDGKFVMLDLYADWCVACKEFEAFTFSDDEVQQLLDDVVLLQVDMSDNNQDDIAIMEHFSVLGLPTIMFFGEQGQELTPVRVTGFLNASEFTEHLEKFIPR